MPHESPFRWVMLGLIWLLYFSFGITSATIPPLAIPIIEDLEMTYTQMGLVLGAWQLIYIITAYPLGTLVDSFGVKKSLLIGIFLIWMSLVLRGLSGNFLMLFLSVALFGFGGPIISIGAPKVISIWFSGNQRGIAAGVYTTGPLIGASLALATAASWVMPLTGSWRGISLIYGAIVLLTMILWGLFSRDVDSDRDGLEQTSILVVLNNLIRIRNVQIIMVLAIAAFFLNHGLNNWLPTLLQEKSMTLSEAGFWTSVSTLIGVIGLAIVPSIARFGYRVISLCILFTIASMTTFCLAVFTDMPLLTVLLLSSIVRAPIMPVLTLVLMETPGVGSSRMGAAGGLFFAAAEIGGFGGPLLLGFIRDLAGSIAGGLFFLAFLIAIFIAMLPMLKEEQGNSYLR